MAFTPAALDFLFENMMHDSRDWYAEHKDDYHRLVLEPFRELIEQLRPTLAAIDERIECDPRRISRLFRDARYAQGKPMFRDSTWCSFCIGRGRYLCPVSFYVDISPRQFSYGLGWYRTPAGEMKAMRKMILDGHPLATAALDAFAAQDVFVLEGETYKREHYPDRTENERQWLGRKTLCLCHDSADFDLLFSDRFGEVVAGDFLLLREACAFFAEASEQAFVDSVNERGILKGWS